MNKKRIRWMSLFVASTWWSGCAPHGLVGVDHWKQDEERGNRMKEHGALVDGAVANFVVRDGDPFECAPLAEEVWIHGKPVSLETRQTRLQDKYIQKLQLKQ